MRYTCDQLFRGKYIQLSTILIPLCLKSTGRYSFNMLSIIKMFYHMYIEYEMYNFAYNTRKNNLYGSLFIYGTMGKWDDGVTFLEILRNLGHWLYVKL